MALTKVSTDGVKDDAITKTKIPANQIEASELADNAVDTNAIADQAVALSKLPHGTSSNDGKFLRANNGADPSFETVTSTTINNNANDRVITGSGTANTLNGESTMTYASNTLKLQDGANDTSLLHIVGAGTSDRGLKIGTSQATGAGQNDGAAVYDAINSESGAYGSQHRFKIAGTDCLTIGYNGAIGYIGIQDGLPYPDNVSGANVSSHLQLGVPTGLTDRATSIKLIGRDGSANGNKCQLQWSGAHNRFDITVNGNQALQIQANKDVEVTDGNLVIGTSGHGIDFSATSGTGTSELFDDYEEGTWTPGAEGFSIGSTYSARYTKIGRIVHLSCYVQAASGSGSSTVNITNLPFTAAGGNVYNYGAGRLGSSNNNNAASDIVFQMQSSTTKIKPYVNDGGINHSMISGTHIIFSIVYEAA